MLTSIVQRRTIQLSPLKRSWLLAGQLTLKNTEIAYADAKHKCLLIIGRKDSKLRQLVQGTRGGIEIVGLAANSAHTGYHVYVKQLEQQGEEVLDFYIPCDGVARSFAFKDEEPFFEISSAQKFKSIQP
ncbi:unnamed protein product, partial [Durusdinium trenchii]